jgi:type IV pilus assembly protein PilN
MRININLASNPYEAAREYTRRMGMLVAALSVVTLGLLGYIAYQRSHTRAVNQQIAAARQEIASLDAEKAQAQTLLNKPQNRDIADQSEFLNTLFARKALSWTKVFAEMEKLMPASIHVISMKPEFNRDNQLVLHMVVATNARDKAVELVGRMEKSPHFRTPAVEAENTTGNAGDVGAAGGNIQFEIAAVYLPFAEDTDTGTDTDTSTKSAGDKQGKAEAPETKAGNPPGSSKPGGAGKPTSVQNRPADVRGAH